MFNNVQLCFSKKRIKGRQDFHILTGFEDQAFIADALGHGVAKIPPFVGADVREIPVLNQRCHAKCPTEGATEVHRTFE